MLDLARFHAVILTSPPPLSALKLRQGWGCESTFLLASPDLGFARPHASPTVLLTGRVVVRSVVNPTTQNSRVAIPGTPSPLNLHLANAVSTLLHPATC